MCKWYPIKTIPKSLDELKEIVDKTEGEWFYDTIRVKSHYPEISNLKYGGIYTTEYGFAKWNDLRSDGRVLIPGTSFYTIVSRPKYWTLADTGFWEHYHCDICSESFDTQLKADECFESHTEIDVLRYIMFNLYTQLVKCEVNRSSDKYLGKVQKYFDKSMNDKGKLRRIIVSAFERFDIEEPDVYLSRDINVIDKMFKKITEDKL